MLVHFILEEADIEPYMNDCEYDYLQLAGGPGTSSGLLCGASVQGYDYVTDGNVATVTFHTDYDYTYPGFSMFYEAISADVNAPTQNTCGDLAINAGSGYITSPGYPNNYPNDLDCVYTITAEEGMVVHFILEEA